MRRSDFPRYERSLRALRMGDPYCPAADKLERHAAHLDEIATRFPPRLRGAALRMLDGRTYCFERNLDRWPDGRYYLLDRGYKFWRGQKIALTLEEATALHVVAWGKTKAVRAGFARSILPLIDDSLAQRPGDWLAPLAGVLQGIARYIEPRDAVPFEQRVKATGIAEERAT